MFREEDLLERWYNYGQTIGIAPDEAHDGEYLPPLFFMVLTSDERAEATLLMTMIVFADSEEKVKAMTTKFADGAKKPANPDASLFLDPFPKSEESALSKFVERYAGKSFQSEEAGKLIHEKLADSRFEVQAAYAKFYLMRFAAGAEKSESVAKKLDKLAEDSDSNRHKEFWTMLQWVTKDKKPLSARRELTGRDACRQSMSNIANAELVYRLKSQSDEFTSDLEKLAPIFEGKPLPSCVDGGKYTVAVGIPPESFTIHCSIPEHDAGRPGEPRGYSPGLNMR